MKNIFLLITLVVSLFAGVSIGHSFPDLTLKDQFDKEQRITADDRLVLISFEKKVSTAFNGYLQKQPETFLQTHRARFISDISAMPMLITRMFALPKMKKYHYSVMLNHDEEFANGFDKKEGMLTVYRLDNGTVTSVDFVAPDAPGALFGE